MSALRESGSGSSGSTEKLTIAYTESTRRTSSSSNGSSTLSSESTTSYSQESWTSQMSMTEVYADIENLQTKELMRGYEPVWRTMSLSEGTKVDALNYFHYHSIFQLFSFFMSHLLVNAPPDPIPFLVSLLDSCLQYRDGDGSPPLIFESRHVQSLYSSLDPLETGSIPYDQYLVGMKTLGLTDFEIWPVAKITPNTRVEKSRFIAEAEKALLKQLDQWLGKGFVSGTPTDENTESDDFHSQSELQHDRELEEQSYGDSGQLPKEDEEDEENET